ncbi:MAG: zinc ribbon domain-containing protein [Lachnospiraceae bacterium]|nr:zinc ribbon domain-containing protein [Lachnospiraceae bacterium]
MFCGSCGARVNDNDRFCTVCGAMRSSVQTESAQNPVANNVNGQQIPYVPYQQQSANGNMMGYDATAVPRAIGAIASLLFAITPFLPFAGALGITMSALEAFTEYDAVNMLVLTILVVVGGLISIIASICTKPGWLIFIGLLGFIYFLFRFIVTIAAEGADYLKLYGVGFYGIGFCSILIFICGLVINSKKTSR